MADNETIADIIAEMETERPGLMNAPINTNNLYYARRLKAAHKRERAKIEADALEVGGIVEAAHKRERGDCAKLREAVGYILKYADSIACRDHDEHTRHYIDQIRKWAQSALSAPPRNCKREVENDD